MNVLTKVSAGCMVASAMFLGAACDGDDEFDPTGVDGGNTDGAVSSGSSGASSGSSSSSGSTSDASTDGSTAETTSVILVNDLLTVENPAVRLCFLATAASDAPTLDDMVGGAPLPQEGFALGAKDVLVPTKLEGTSFRPIAFYKSSLDIFSLADKSCQELRSELTFVEKRGYPQPDATDGGADAGPVGELIPPAYPSAANGTLIEGADFELGEIVPRGGFTAGKRHMLLVTGCPFGTTSASVDLDNCGSGFQVGVTSDFHSFAYDLEAAPAVSGKNRVQYVYASWNGYRQFTEQVGSSTSWARLNYGVDNITLIAEDRPFVLPSTQVAAGVEVNPLSTILTLGTSPLPPAEELFFDDDLATVQTNSGLTVLEAGKAYTLLSVGDPSLPPGAKSYRHVLIPTN